MKLLDELGVVVCLECEALILESSVALHKRWHEANRPSTCMCMNVIG